MQIFLKIVSWLRNKYIVATTFFVIWIVFFDHNDLITQSERRNELRKIEQSKLYFQQQIDEDRKFSNDLEYDAAAIEKYAREKYLMKRDNEDLFIIQPMQKN